MIFLVFTGFTWKNNRRFHRKIMIEMGFMADFNTFLLVEMMRRTVAICRSIEPGGWWWLVPRKSSPMKTIGYPYLTKLWSSTYALNCYKWDYSSYNYGCISLKWGYGRFFFASDTCFLGYNCGDYHDQGCQLRDFYGNFGCFVVGWYSWPPLLVGTPKLCIVQSKQKWGAVGRHLKDPTPQL